MSNLAAIAKADSEPFANHMHRRRRSRQNRLLVALRKLRPAKAIVLLLVGGSCAALLAVAQADDSGTFKRRVYVDVGAGATMLEPKSSHSSLSVSDDTDSGFHVAVGYDFATRLSAEVYFADLGSAGIAFLGTDIGDVDYSVYGVSLLGYLYNSRSHLSGKSTGVGLPLREGLSLYTRLGVGAVNASSTIPHNVDHGGHLAMGLGAEYGWKNGLAVRGEYMALDTDQHYAKLSVVKRFGKVDRAIPAAAVVPLVIPADATPETPAAAEPPVAANTSVVNFEFDKYRITPALADSLNNIADRLRTGTGDISVEGHTDWIANDAYNDALSIRRARAVHGFLLAAGINGSRLSMQGFGESRPVATNETREGRALNRRVEIREF